MQGLFKNFSYETHPYFPCPFLREIPKAGVPCGRVIAAALLQNDSRAYRQPGPPTEEALLKQHEHVRNRGCRRIVK